MAETFETMDVTKPDQVDEAPIIEPIEQAPAEEKPEDAPGVEEETLTEANNEAEPEADNIQGSIDSLNARLDAIVEKIETLSKVLDNINNLEEARAAGPQGFFKPVEDGSKPEADKPFPYIEKIYK